MALKRFRFLHLISIVFVFPLFGSSNFPLDDCSTGEMDVLGLYAETYSNRENELTYQKRAFSGLMDHLLSFPGEKSGPRVQFAQVQDTISSDLPNFNFSSWTFGTSYRPESYMIQNQKYEKQVFKSVTEVVTLKIQFAEHLFLHMGGVRENASHIAVIFIDGEDLYYGEKRRIPEYVRQHRTGMKIFVIVVSINYDNEMVHFSDALFVKSDLISEHLLVMAMCKECKKEWFMFEHRDSIQFLSCYKLIDCGVKVEAHSFLDYMFYDCHFAAMETNEELMFIKNRMYSYIEDTVGLQGNVSSDLISSAEMYISLSKDATQNAGRFSWTSTNPLRTLPNVVNNWLPGKPSAGRTSSCTVWTFVWNNDGYVSENMSSSQNSSFDGWRDVNCDSPEAAYRFCEVELPRQIELMNITQIKPASDEIFTQALSKGDFITWRSNIVSVSANIADNVFLQFLKSMYTENMFPIFDCGVEASGSRYISYLFVCDTVNHCSNKRDETSCLIDSEETKTECITNCNGVHCCDGSCLPLQWVNDGEVDCTICPYNSDTPLTDETPVIHKYLKRNITCSLICNFDECVQFSQLNDGHIDCTGKEGPLDETIGKLETTDTCQNLLGDTIWAPRCVFVRDMYGGMMGCRDMSHLDNCYNFVCPEGYIKCTNSFCIPQHYVLDKTWDCPLGEDEQNDIIGPCTGNFACWNSKVCLHPSLVCNGHPDCPHGDDESDCRSECTDGFRCIAGTMTVEDYNLDATLINIGPYPENINYINWSGVNMSQSKLYPIFYAYAATIVWSNCQIHNPKYLTCFCLRKVQDLDMSYNLLEALDGRDNYYGFLQNVRRMNYSYNTKLMFVRYLKLNLLETLDLSHTAVADIGATVFESLPKLKHLDLSFTRIFHLNKNTFPKNTFLQYLDIRGLALGIFSEDVFNSLSIEQHFYTDSFELCCPQIRGPNILSHTCHAPADAISSCFDLIGAGTQRVIICIVAVLAVFGNLTVIGYRVTWNRPTLKTGYGLFVTNLGISDFIMGLYLCIIIGADYYFRDVYVLNDRSWRESITCKVAGSLATLSCETSTFFILLITLDRFLVMKFPFGQIKLSKVTKYLCVVSSWIIGFIIALSPNVFDFEIYSSNAVCLGLPLTTKQMKGWAFSFSVFIALNSAMCIVIAFSQRSIFRAMSENRITTSAPNTSSRRPEDLIVAKQLSLVAMANFLCWFPVGVLAVLSLCKYEISNDVYAWTIAVVLPINAASNPILYTIPAVLDTWNNLKSGRRTISRDNGQ